MNWQNDGDTTKSDGSINKLVNEVLLHPDFQLSDLRRFSARRENEIADKADTKSTLLTSFSEASVDIEVLSGDKNIPSAKFSVTGLHYRPLLSILRSAFADPLAAKYTVQGPGRAGPRPFLLALTLTLRAGPPSAWPLPGAKLTPGQQGRARVGPGHALAPAIIK